MCLFNHHRYCCGKNKNLYYRCTQTADPDTRELHSRMRIGRQYIMQNNIKIRQEMICILERRTDIEHAHTDVKFA